MPDKHNRTLEEREEERRGRFASINDLVERLAQQEREVARMALQRFASGELTLGEVYVEYERWEAHVELLRTYSEEDPRRDGGIAYAETRMNDLARLGNRILGTAGRRLSRRHRQFDEPDFARARFADLVGLAESLGYEVRKSGRNWVMSCPWHGNDTSPSLTIYEPGLGWHCFGCGRGGRDAASFAAEHFSCSQAEGLLMVLELCDVVSEAEVLPDR